MLLGQLLDHYIDYSGANSFSLHFLLLSEGVLKCLTLNLQALRELEKNKTSEHHSRVKYNFDESYNVLEAPCA